MELSLFLAKVIGLYLIIISLSLFFNQRRMQTIMAGIMENPAEQFLLGLIILISGLLLVVSHNVWVFAWPVVITLLGWAILIKGILNTTFPSIPAAMTKSFLQSHSILYIALACNFIIGIYLCYYGFFTSIS